MARRNPPDLLMADVMIPGLDGFELLQRVRSDETLKTTPVVLVAARAGEDVVIEGILAGADDYIAKPFSARELVARVGAQLARASARRRAEALNAFRIRLSDTLRPLSDPLQVQQIASRLIAEQLGADRAYFVEIDETTNQFVIQGEYHLPGVPAVVGRFAVAEFQARAWEFRKGRPMMIVDLRD